jgi:hypothetical protein
MNPEGVMTAEYDPDFVASILRADAAPPEASFNNVVDMLEFLDSFLVDRKAPPDRITGAVDAASGEGEG